MSLLGHPKVIPYTKFEHFGIIRLIVFEFTLRTNRQTDKQTDGLENPTLRKLCWKYSDIDNNNYRLYT